MFFLIHSHTIANLRTIIQSSKPNCIHYSPFPIIVDAEKIAYTESIVILQ